MLIAIADDFSGAAEIAGVAYQAGLAVEVQLDELRACRCDAVILDCDCRSSSPDEIVQTLETVAGQIASIRPDGVYFKIDSLLRGPVGLAVSTLARALQRPRVLLVNSNPRKHRCVINGHLIVNGIPVDQTGFASDPEHPRSSSSVVDLLCSPDCNLQRSDIIAVDCEGPLPPNGFFVGNAGSSVSLRRHDQRCDASVLQAGAAEFFEAFVERFHISPATKPYAPMPSEGSKLFVCGSAAHWEDRQRLMSQLGIQLPRIDDNGGTPAVNRTGAQSSIIALNDHQLLILSRDGNGRGSSGAPVFKSVLLADLKGATNIDGLYDVEGNAVAPGGVLNPAVTPISWVEALNMLGKLDLSVSELEQFGLNLNAAPGNVNTLAEKWEGLSLVSAQDPSAPNDYFLFIGNDNDFLTGTGKYLDAAGNLQSYNSGLENDTMILAYRVQIVPEPSTYALCCLGALAVAFARRRR